MQPHFGQGLSAKAIGKRNQPKQKKYWISPNKLSPQSGSPSYSLLNYFLDEDGPGAWPEKECPSFSTTRNRLSILPTIYSRLLFTDYPEDFQFKRPIAWYCPFHIILLETSAEHLYFKIPSHSRLTFCSHHLPSKLYHTVFHQILKIAQYHGSINSYTPPGDSTLLVVSNAFLWHLKWNASWASFRDYIKDMKDAAGWLLGTFLYLITIMFIP